MHIFPKEQLEVDGQLIQDTLRFGLRSDNAEKAFHQLKKRMRDCLTWWWIVIWSMTENVIDGLNHKLNIGIQ